jgi:hypothetical protein
VQADEVLEGAAATRGKRDTVSGEVAHACCGVAIVVVVIVIVIVIVR